MEGGALWDDLYRNAEEEGLTAPGGSFSKVGVAGQTLHGGYGWLCRRFGMTIDSLVGAEVVTATGEVLEVSETSHGELLWALKGGGGNFGVVAALEFEAQRIPETLDVVGATYDAGQAKEVLRAFEAFMKTAPEEFSAVALLWTAPNRSLVPPAIQGQEVVTLWGCYYGSWEEGRKLVAPLFELGDLLGDLGGTMSFVELNRLFEPDYPSGDFYYWKSVYLEKLTEKVLDLLTEGQQSRPSDRTRIDLYALGGAIAEVSPQETAYSHRSEPWMVVIEGHWTEAEESRENLQWARQFFEKLWKYSAKAIYPNFPGLEEDPRSPDVLDKNNWRRLRRVKRKYDPENLFGDQSLLHSR